MNFKLNKDKAISGYALRILYNHIPTFNPTYPLLSAIMVTLVEQLKKQDSVIKIILLPIADPALSPS